MSPNRLHNSGLVELEVMESPGAAIGLRSPLSFEFKTGSSLSDTTHTGKLDFHIYD